MDIHRLTRRQLLKVTIAGLVSYVLPKPDDASAQGHPDLSPSVTSLASNQPDVVAGVIERIQLPRALNIRTVKGPAAIQFSDDAAFWHSNMGRVQGIAAFAPGEEVVAEGHWMTDAFAATALMSMCRLTEGHIIRRQENRLYTTSGIVRLTSDTRPEATAEGVAKPLTELTTGDEIIALVWVDPDTGDRVALKICVKTR